MSSSPALPDKVLAIDESLSGERIPHAFGGALALAYYAEPRATIDIDVNLFIDPTEADRAEHALTPLGVSPDGDRVALERDGPARWWWDRTPVDLFFANDPIHQAMREQLRRVPFGEARIPILSPEHLMVCKVAFDRAKDWLDIEQMLLLDPELDRRELQRWLDRVLDRADQRYEHIARLLDRAAPS